MVFKRVDVVEQEEIEGFSYLNKIGTEERVTLDGWTIITIKDSEDCSTVHFKEDIPKLILALQAAYDHKEN